jgi:protein tyrosine phosphatase (PTP) superfamily phosphohydrolase (DUF442 family)
MPMSFNLVSPPKRVAARRSAPVSTPSAPTPRTRRRGRWWLVAPLLLLTLAFGLEAWRVCFGPNFATIAEGRLYRSAQLKPRQLQEAVRRFGIKTVINLRGHCPQEAWHRDESNLLARLGVALVDVNFSSSMPPPVPELRKLLAALDTAERPILLHCRRGADRTSIAAAFALLLEPDATLADGQKQLSFRYGHAPFGNVQILDACFADYPAWLAERGLAHAPERLRHWVMNDYQPRHCWAEIVPLEVPDRLVVGKWSTFRFRVENRSRLPWQFKQAAHAGIHLRLFVRDPATEAFIATAGAGFFDQIVPPGGSLDLTVALPPLRQPGVVDIFVDLSDEQMCWFHMVGSPPWEKRLEVSR